MTPWPLAKMLPLKWSHEEHYAISRRDVKPPRERHRPDLDRAHINVDHTGYFANALRSIVCE